MTETAAFGDGATARVVKMEAVEGTAELPGEKSGPAVAFDLEITNGTAAPIDLTNVTVDLTNSEGLSASQISTMGTIFSGTVPAGGTATAKYVYTVPAEDRADARLNIKYSAGTPVVVFTGSLPDA
jgi:hypothetical protein